MNMDFNVPILTYHSVDDSGSVISVLPETFRRQMQLLRDLSCAAISLREFVRAVREQRPIAPRTVVITFDDGYRNFYTDAFPVLRRHGFHATMFLVSGYCGRDNDWPGQWPGIRKLPLLGWDEIAEMHRDGIEFGSHTATHPDLSRIPLAEAAREIQDSKTDIEARLGAPVTTFAYPYGRFTPSLAELVRREFDGAVTTELAAARTGCDLHLLDRVDMFYFSNPRLFRAMIENRANGYLQCRRLLRKLNAALRDGRVKPG
jgi:peptidoglycan/xylan/chitin deacetylase (PgdA/CDA1 family)